jgi:hypothetical protein
MRQGTVESAGQETVLVGPTAQTVMVAIHPRSGASHAFSSAAELPAGVRSLCKRWIILPEDDELAPRWREPKDIDCKICRARIEAFPGPRTSLQLAQSRAVKIGFGILVKPYLCVVGLHRMIGGCCLICGEGGL